MSVDISIALMHLFEEGQSTIVTQRRIFMKQGRRGGRLQMDPALHFTTHIRIASAGLALLHDPASGHEHLLCSCMLRATSKTRPFRLRATSLFAADFPAAASSNPSPSFPALSTEVPSLLHLLTLSLPYSLLLHQLSGCLLVFVKAWRTAQGSNSASLPSLYPPPYAFTITKEVLFSLTRTDWTQLIRPSEPCHQGRSQGGGGGRPPPKSGGSQKYIRGDPYDLGLRRKIGGRPPPPEMGAPPRNQILATPLPVTDGESHALYHMLPLPSWRPARNTPPD